jgi:hypothetical protein
MSSWCSEVGVRFVHDHQQLRCLAETTAHVYTSVNLHDLFDYVLI